MTLIGCDCNKTLLCRLDDPSGAAKEKLLLQLEALKNVKLSAGSGGVDKNTAAVSEENVTYELLMKPESSKLADQKRIAELDRRLEHLEKMLAFSPERMVGHYLLFTRNLTFNYTFIICFAHTDFYEKLACNIDDKNSGCFIDCEAGNTQKLSLGEILGQSFEI